MKHFSIITILFVCAQLPAHAKVIESKNAENYVRVTNEIVLEMLRNYQKLKSYHCLWQAELAQGKQQLKLELETAFDRKTGKTLFVMRSYQKKGKKWILAGGLLQIYDGDRQKVAVSQIPGKPMVQNEKIIADPNQFTYRDFRRGLAFIYPFDLPMLYRDHALTEYPLMEILQGQLKGIRIIEPAPEEPADMTTIELLTNETCARMRVDPKTLLVNYFVYFSKTSGKTLGPEYKLASISIDKPLKSGLFDFNAQLKNFNPDDAEEQPADMAAGKTSEKTKPQ